MVTGKGPQPKKKPPNRGRGSKRKADDRTDPDNIKPALDGKDLNISLSQIGKIVPKFPKKRKNADIQERSKAATSSIEEETNDCIYNQIQETEVQFIKDEVSNGIEIDADAKCPVKDKSITTEGPSVDSQVKNQNSAVQEFENKSCIQVCNNNSCIQNEGLDMQNHLVNMMDTPNLTNVEQSDDNRRTAITVSIKTKDENKVQVSQDGTTLEERIQEEHAGSVENSSDKNSIAGNTNHAIENIEVLGETSNLSVKSGIDVREKDVPVNHTGSIECSNITDSPCLNKTEVSTTEHDRELVNVITQKVVLGDILPAPVVNTTHTPEEQPIGHTCHQELENCVQSKVNGKAIRSVDWQPNDVINIGSYLQQSMSKYENENRTGVALPEISKPTMKNNSDADEILKQPLEIYNEKNINKTNLGSSIIVSHEKILTKPTQTTGELQNTQKTKGIVEEAMKTESSVDIGQFLSSEFSPKMTPETSKDTERPNQDELLIKGDHTVQSSHRAYKVPQADLDCGAVNAAPDQDELDDMDVTDSQLCAADWQLGTKLLPIPVMSRTASKILPKQDGTCIVKGLIKELSLMNKLILKTRREIEAAHREKLGSGRVSRIQKAPGNRRP